MITLGTRIAAVVICAGLGVTASPARATEKPVCAMLSTNDLRAWWGKDMEVRKMVMELPQAAGCDWGATDGKGGLLTVRIVPARYYTEPTLGHGFKRLSGIAEKAFVVPQLGGWSAGARKGAKAVVIQTDGGTSNDKTAITVLKKVIAQI